MTPRTLTVVLTGLCTAAALVAAQPASADKDKDKDKKKDPVVQTPAEEGCFDITDGTANYDRDDKVADLAPVLRTVDPNANYPDALQENSGTASLTLFLAAPSCSSTTYTLTVFGSDMSVLATHSVTGDGASGTQSQPLVLVADVTEYADDCLMLVAETSQDGVVVDMAPDEIDDYRSICDGGSPGQTYR